MTGRAKERIAQSKRARAGSLAIIDATSGANLYPPGVWFADVMSSFSRVTFALFCLVFVIMLSLKVRPFVQSFFVLRYACVPTATFVSSFLPFFGHAAFPRFLYHNRFCPFMESTPYVFPFRMVFFYVVTTGCIFDISLRENSIKIKRTHLHG